MNPDQVILFDVSGVLVELAGMPDFMKWTGRSADDTGSHWLMSESVRDFESGRIHFQEFHTLFVDEWKVNITRKNLSEAFESWVMQAVPGALELLHELKNQYTLACLTNTNSIQWPVIQETIETETNFEHQFVSYIMGKVKPDAETYEYVIKSLSVPAENIVFLDDSAKNVAAANAIGINAYQVKGISEIRSVLIENGTL